MMRARRTESIKHINVFKACNIHGEFFSQINTNFPSFYFLLDGHGQSEEGAATSRRKNHITFGKAGQEQVQGDDDRRERCQFTKTLADCSRVH